jgi:hypothetical protein
MIGPSGTIDPELLRGRVAALADVTWKAAISAVADNAIACLGQLSVIDFVGLEREAPHKSGRELWTMCEAQVAAIWGGVEELRAAMQPLIKEHQAHLATAQGAAAGDDLDGLDFGGDPAAPPAPRAPVAAAPATSEAGAYLRILETVWAMSFVLQGELDGFRRRLPALFKVAEGWELVSSLQDHVGHMRSAVSALCTGMFASLPGGAHNTIDDNDVELEAARELRSRIFQLRDEILALEAEMQKSSPATWQHSVQRAYGLVELFMFGPAFAWLRAGDKRSFLQHQRGLKDILGLWSPLRAEPARREIGAIARYLEALEMINQRECLVVHDRAALTKVVDALSLALKGHGSDARTAMGRGLGALAEAQGRDRELDALLVQTLAPGSPVPVEAILARAIEVLRGMGG